MYLLGFYCWPLSYLYSTLLICLTGSTKQASLVLIFLLGSREGILVMLIPVFLQIEWTNPLVYLVSNRMIKNENSASLNVTLEPIYMHQEVVVSFV